MIAFFVSIMLTPLVKAGALHFGAIDKPGKRKVHSKDIPKLGGIAIFFGVIVAMLAAHFFYGSAIDGEMVWILLGAAAVVVLGIVDDLYCLQAPIKLLGQICIALLVVMNGVEIDFLKNPFTLQLLDAGTWAKIISVGWILILMNVVNLIDGLDGLAAGISLISAISLFIISIILNQLNVSFLLLAIAGACLGFLRFNFNPASIFMGDTGSLFLGYILAVASIQGVLKSSAIISLAIPVLSLLIPLGDTVMAIIRRLKRGTHIFRADAEHIHHQLLGLGFSHKQTVLLIYISTVALNLMAIVFSFTSGVWSYITIVLMIAVIAWAILQFKKVMEREGGKDGSR